MASMRKRLGMFLAQFLGDRAPFNSLASKAKWEGDLGFRAIPIASCDARLLGLRKAASSQTYCDQVI